MTQIQMRRDDWLTWNSENPVLASGEIGFETDSGRFKIGDGSSTWGALPYFQNKTQNDSDILTSITAHADSIKGTGNPNGVHAAPVGSVFRNTETGGWIGARVWRKDSGSGNTGWVVESGDTGTRAMPILSENGYTGGSVRLRRIGNMCYLTGLSLTRASTVGGYQAVTDIPAGMRPLSPAYFRTLIGSAYGYVTHEVTIAAAGLNENFTVTWMTAEAWPTTLPGTPA